MGTDKTKELEVVKETIVTGKKKQKISVSYTVKAVGQHIKKLHEAKMTTEEENKTLLEIHKKLIERWISMEMGI